MRAPLSIPKLLLVTVPMFGIGLAWACQYAKVTPVLQQLGVSNNALALAWLAGPISGILVQPVVGRLSDRSVSCVGRRRMWMWLGSLGLSCWMVLLAWSPSVGRALGDNSGSARAADGAYDGAIELCLLSSQVFPSLDNHVAVARIEFKAVAGPVELLGGDERGSAAEERVEDQSLWWR